MKYSRLTRRCFLRGAGGSAFAVPFLPSLVGEAKAAAVKPPLRFAMALGHYGRDRKLWSPALTDAQLTNVDGVLAAKLTDIQGPISYIVNTPFDPLRKKFSILQGLDSLRSDGGHNEQLPTTGCSVSPAHVNGFGYSIDCVLEESSKFYATPPGLGALRTNPYADAAGLFRAFNSFSWTSKAKVGQHLKPEWSPHMVYENYFNPASLQSRTDRNGRIRGVTSLAYESFRQVVSSPRIGAADRSRLDDYMSLMSQIDKVLARPPVSCAGNAAPTTFPNADALHGAMIDLEVAALACGLTKIVMHAIHHWTSALNANPLESHSSAHAGSQVPAGATVSIASGFNRWTMNLVADFMRKLDAVTEPDGSTLLDNTLFIYSNEDGSGGHEHVDLPVLIAGGQGKIRSGYYIDYRPRPFRRGTPLGRPYNALLVSAFKALGFTEADYQKFGRPGFGRYEVTNMALFDHYAPFLAARVNDPLPFLMA